MNEPILLKRLNLSRKLAPTTKEVQDKLNFCDGLFQAVRCNWHLPPVMKVIRCATQMVCFITWSINSSVTEKPAAVGQVCHKLKCTQATKRWANSHSKNRCFNVSSSALQKEQVSMLAMLKRIPNREPV